MAGKRVGVVAQGREHCAEPVQRRLVQVGFGVEVTVKDHSADAGLGGDLVEPSGSESIVGERFGRRDKDLLAPLQPGQPADRSRLRLGCHNRPPTKRQGNTRVLTSRCT
jgi:hypothetical protein